MQIPSKKRASGMDSGQAILPDALRVTENLFPTDLCWNPGCMDSFMLTILGTGYPLTRWYNELLADKDRIDCAKSWGIQHKP